MEVVRGLFKNCLVLVIVGTPIALVMCFIFTILALGVAYDTIPDLYNETLSRWLEIGCSASFELSEEDAARLEAEGYDPDDVANAIAASNWCSSHFGGNVDVGIMLAIWQSESGSGSNMGSCDGISSAVARLGDLEEDAANLLLDRWQAYNVRGRNPIAAEYIYPDYSGYTGHCSAGEIGGGGFIPTTAYYICANGLSGSGDTELSSCDFWSTKVAFHAMAYWLDTIGYDASDSDEEKVSSLYGWNRDEDYRRDLVDRSQGINEIAGGLQVAASFAEDKVLGESFKGDLQLLAIGILGDIGLLPEAGQPWLELPLRPGDMNGITQEYMETTYDSRGHPGIDYSCNSGTEILAVGDGRVVFTIRQFFGFGTHVWIKHPNGLFTVYAHLSDIAVNVGQSVRGGQVIGLCGSTGNSTGSHLHFGVYKEGPNNLLWNYRASSLDPKLYLGTCAVARAAGRVDVAFHINLSAVARAPLSSFLVVFCRPMCIGPDEAERQKQKIL